jgi:hypothetical protein
MVWNFLLMDHQKLLDFGTFLILGIRMRDTQTVFSLFCSVSSSVKWR